MREGKSPKGDLVAKVQDVSIIFSFTHSSLRAAATIKFREFKVYAIKVLTNRKIYEILSRHRENIKNIAEP